MKFQFTSRTKHIAAGSLCSIAIIAALVPFNMGGGCSVGGGSGGTNYGAIAGGALTMFQSQTLSEKDEVGIGQSVGLQATNRWPLYRDQNLTRYVTLVARTVGAVSTENGLKWYVGILDTDDINAFSGPHGYIFITRGALRRMQDESELAGVLGHEIGHICKHHGLAAVRSSNFFAGMLQAASGSDKHFAAFKDVADNAVNAIVNVGFNEPQEIEADAEGVKYAMAAGYDPNGFLHFLQRMQKDQAGGGKPFGTHPGIGDRIKLVTDQINKSNTKTGAVLADRFGANVTLK